MGYFTKEDILEFVRQNPKSTSRAIAEHFVHRFGGNLDTVRLYLFLLYKRGVLDREVTRVGMREQFVYTIHDGPPVKRELVPKKRRSRQRPLDHKPPTSQTDPGNVASVMVLNVGGRIGTLTLKRDEAYGLYVSLKAWFQGK